MNLPELYIIGSGNLASHLADQFIKHNLPVKGLIARNQKEGRQICRKNKIPFLKSTAHIACSDSIIFCCISDDSINNCINDLRNLEARVVHCSGMKEIPEKRQNDQCRFGVFYPVLSFSKNIPVDWKDVPVCIEAHDLKTEKVLKSIAQKISGRPYAINSAERSVIHLAAVFANNFSNMMYIISEELLKHHQLTFDLMKPLILQTALKAVHVAPASVQTGPGRRGDQKTIRAHRKLLEENPEMLKVYNTLTAIIHRRYHS